MKFPAVSLYSPFVLSLFGGAIAISDAGIVMKVVFILMSFILFASISMSITGGDFRYKPWVHVMAAIAFFIFFYYVIARISWLTAGKPGTIFYSGPLKFYHIFNAQLSVSGLIAALPCLMFESDVERFLKGKIKSSAGVFLIYLICAIMVIVSVAIWYSYLSLPTQEFG